MDTEKRPKYYMVRVHEGRPPRVKHLSLTEAMLEAERLTRMTGKPATVLSSAVRSIPDENGGVMWQDATP